MVEFIEKSNRRKIEQEILKIGIDSAALKILADKADSYLFKLRKIRTAAANIIKQEMIAAGGDAAVSRNSINCKDQYTDVLLIGSAAQYRLFIHNVIEQPFKIKDIAAEIKKILDYKQSREMILKSGRIISWKKYPAVMGILNITPDSFSDGGLFLKTDSALKQTEKMIRDGADIIDIGGESSRPGADSVSEEVEKERVLPVIKEIKKNFDIPISIDTYKKGAAEAALDLGADIVNDISAGRFDSELPKLIKEREVPYIIMHMLGEPKSMQNNPEYDNPVADIFDFLQKRVDHLTEIGIDRNLIIVDPGIGFGKRLEDNLQILNKLKQYSFLGCPVLLGASRKSFIGGIDNSKADFRLGGSLAAVYTAYKYETSFVRVHDVQETVQFLKTMSMIEKFS